MAQRPFQKEKLLIIGEAGVNHCGRFDDAIALCVIAKEAGCDAVKFQVYQPRDLWTEEPDIIKREKLQLTIEQYAKVFDYAHGIGLLVGASFFSYYGQVLQHKCDFVKIASRSFPDRMPPLITPRPTLVSCGRYLPAEPNPEWVYMACVSSYPTEKVPFAAMQYLAALSDHGVWGYSSHFVTPYNVDSMAAVRQGARIIEKHFCIDRAGIEIDKRVSLEPDELKHFTEQLRGQMGKP
jgi:N-acetylneuraminate synthase